jgi:hypothetical protein
MYHACSTWYLYLSSARVYKLWVLVLGSQVIVLVFDFGRNSRKQLKWYSLLPSRYRFSSLSIGFLAYVLFGILSVTARYRLLVGPQSVLVKWWSLIYETWMADILSRPIAAWLVPLSTFAFPASRHLVAWCHPPATGLTLACQSILHRIHTFMVLTLIVNNIL